MTDLSEQRDETLGEFVAERARRASAGSLAWQTITAVLAAVAVVAWRGPAWDLRLAIATGLLSFGLWGVADRDLDRDDARAGSRRVARSARVVAGVLGFGAFAYLMMAVLGRLLGRIIS